MQRLHEAADDLGLAGVLAVVFAQLASVVVEGPEFGDFFGTVPADNVLLTLELEMAKMAIRG